MVRYQLSRALAFSWIKAGGLDVIRYYLPSLLTLLCLAIYFLALDLGVYLPPRRIASIAANVLVTLPGFYIAALAAVSAFQSPYLDQLVESPGAKVNVLTKGNIHSIDLTYRMYICYLFAYLTVLSFILYACLSLSVDFSNALATKANINIAAAINFAGSVALTFLTLNLLVVTLHGLYFLAERMHRPYA